MSSLKYLSILILGVFLSQTPCVLAHDGYSYQCCSDKDCHPVECSELTQNDDGSISYQKYNFNKSQVHPSFNSQCHVCVHEYTQFQETNKTPICVYIQQGS